MIGAGIDTLWPAELPASIQVTTAVRLIGLPEELGDGQKHLARTVVRGPDGDIVSEMEGEFELEGGPEEVLHPDWLQGIVLNLAVGFEAAGEGTYKIEHSVDASSASVAMHIRLGPKVPEV
jgi:hypothetical protein